MTADGDNLPNPSRIVRYVPYGKMRKDEDDNYIGPFPSAFEGRPVDHYLSVTWCEYSDGSQDSQLRCAIEAIRNSNINVKTMACFCVTDTPKVLDAISDTGRAGRAIFYPEEDNPAHAGVHGITPDDLLLLARLADEVWCSFLTKAAADALPLGNCIKSPEVG